MTDPSLAGFIPGKLGQSKGAERLPYIYIYMYGYVGPGRLVNSLISIDPSLEPGVSMQLCGRLRMSPWAQFRRV